MPGAISILLLLAALVSGAAAEMLDETTAAAHARLLSPETLARFTTGEYRNAIASWPPNQPGSRRSPTRQSGTLRA
jgi:hypothetical protein